MSKCIRLLASCAFALCLQQGTSHAVTIGFGGTQVSPYDEGGYSVTVPNFVNTVCATDPCVLLGTQQFSTLKRNGGGNFSLNSFWFQFVSPGSDLTIVAFNGLSTVATINLAESAFTYLNGGQTYLFGGLFSNVTSIDFMEGIKTAHANLSVIDDIDVSAASVISPVPLPAGLPFLASGLGLVGLLGRLGRKKHLSR